MPLTQREKERLIVDAKARITWGDPMESVREMLVTAKVPGYEADEILRELMLARAASIRRRGILNLGVSCGAFGLMAIMFLIPWWLERVGIRMGRASGMVWAIGALCGIYGASLVVDGIERVTRGANAAGADSDVNE
jgi:hypothetical protein